MRSGLPFRLPWRRILVRSGFMAYPIDDLRVSLADEREKNLAYLERILGRGGFGWIEGKICRFDEPEVSKDFGWIRWSSASWEPTGDLTTSKFWIPTWWALYVG